MLRYYTPTMFGTQTDMSVLKDLISETLPELDDHSNQIGVPLELLGSQVRIFHFDLNYHEIECLMLNSCVVVTMPFYNNISK